MATVFFSIIALALILSALVSRRRIMQCHIIHDAPHAPSAAYRFITAEGTVIDAPFRRSACNCAYTHDLDLLDIMPADLPAENLLAVMQLYSPARYRTNRIARGVSAGRALIISEAVAERAGIGDDREVSSAELFDLARRLKKFAPCRAGLAIAPGMAKGKQPETGQQEAFQLIYGNSAPLFAAANIAITAIILLGLAVAPAAALAALFALHLQPLAAALGTPARPGDLFSATLLRSPLLLTSSVAVIRGMLTSRATDPGRLQARQEYEKLLSAGTERFFDRRAEACPMCRAADLSVLTRSHEPVMHKPGTFILEKCGSCGHIFQNPVLNSEGLSFYYRDLYDGLGAPLTDIILGSDDSVYRRRLELFSRYCTPNRWLDVGGGNGYLCCVGKGFWPRTTFDGLDLSRGIQDAQEQGWIAAGYRGMLPDHADQLAGKYDVISMMQFLEHTPRPEDNLRAAHSALAEEGLLFVEVPNPDFRPGRMLGRFWFQWLQPQHIHFFSIPTMSRLLADCGFTPLAWHVREAHIPIDCVCAAIFFLRLLAPPAHYPWHEKKGWAYGLWRSAVFTLGSPLIAAGFLADMLLVPLCKMLNMSNNYLVVAQRAGSRQTSARPEDLSPIKKA